MTKDIAVGLVNEVQDVVTAKDTAAAMGSGCLDVYATPAMCALMERAASELMDTIVDDGDTTVGIALNISHTAATPVGMQVSAKAEIVAVEGRKIYFKLTASDETGEIGNGIHERFIVNRKKFQERTDSKLG